MDRAQSDSNVTEIERFSKNVKRPKSFRRNSADNGKPQTFPIESKDDLINWYKEGIDSSVPLIIFTFIMVIRFL